MKKYTLLANVQRVIGVVGWTVVADDEADALRRLEAGEGEEVLENVMMTECDEPKVVLVEELAEA
jgi:hypothetical protein